MKTLLFVSFVFSALSMAVSARATNMLVKAPPLPTEPLPYNWSGLYAGVNFGGAWTNGSLNIPGNNFYGGITEFIGGVQAGYNIQSGHLLFGVEGQFDGATFDHPTLIGLFAPRCTPRNTIGKLNTAAEAANRHKKDSRHLIRAARRSVQEEV